MCLAVPAQVIERRDDEAVADLHGNRVKVSTVLVPEVVVGDWVLIHAGFAIQRMDAQTAEETWAVLEDLREAEAAERHEGTKARRHEGGRSGENRTAERLNPQSAIRNPKLPSPETRKR